MINKDPIRNSINEFFILEKQNAEKIFTQLFLYICSLETKNSSNSSSDLYILAKLLKVEDIKKIVDYFDGDIIRIPRKEDYRNSMLVALCFFLKVIKDYEWSDIKDFLSLSENNSDMLSPISIGRKINNIQKSLSKDIIIALKELEINNIDELFDCFKDINGYIKS